MEPPSSSSSNKRPRDERDVENLNKLQKKEETKDGKSKLKLKFRTAERAGPSQVKEIKVAKSTKNWSEVPLANSFSAHVDVFSEECDIIVDNYEQTILEEPTFPWVFTLPKKHSDPEFFKFEIKLRKDLIVGHRNGRQPPRLFLDADGISLFSVTARNLSEKSVKCAMSVQIIFEDGRATLKKKEPAPFVREPNATFTLNKLGRGTKFLNSQKALHIVVQMEIYNGVVYESSNKKIKLDRTDSTYKTLADDVKNMLNEEGFDDVKLECDEATIKCNKFLLCARSKVFRAMFHHRQMKEAKENKVIIEDAEPGTVRDLVQFIYSDEVEGIDLERTVKLLPLAERYDIPSLSSFCREALSTHLNVEHAAEVAMVADQHQLKDLLKRAVAFMVQNSNRVIKTDTWKILLQTCPDIANQIILTLSKFRDDSNESGHSRGGIRLHTHQEVLEDPMDYTSFNLWPPPNNPEEEHIPQFQPNHPQVADEWIYAFDV